MRGQLHKIAGIAVAATLASCGRVEMGEPHYAHSQCQRVGLISEGIGQSLIGVEDLAIDRANGKLFVAAYDRRATEKAARKRAKSIPQGGLYQVDVSSIFSREGSEVPVAQLVSPADFTGGLRPHGLTFDESNNEIVFINRTYQQDGTKWTMTPKVRRIGANGEIVVGSPVNTPCAANDVLAKNGKLLTSFDHGSCSWPAAFENIFSLKRSGVASHEGEPIFKRAVFANGLEETQAGAVALAATREKALIFLSSEEGALKEKSRVKLPGGPDNLTRTNSGEIVAAVHPSLIRLAFNRKLGIGKSPSRIVRTDPQDGQVELLFDDPSGKLFSAATVGLETGQGLIVGSVTDEGVLVCREGA